jgi:acyl-CoA synthetase (AMP-forming)/AMP-acid ligase II
MKKASRPLDPGFEPTIPNLLAHAARSFADREFLVEGEQRMTYAEVEARSAELAKGLLALGVSKGTRLGLLMPNGIEWALHWLAAARIGALTIPLSTLYKTHELAYGLAHTDVQFFIVSPAYLTHDYVARLEEGLPGLVDHRDPELYVPSHPYLRRIVIQGDVARPWALGRDAIEAAAKSRPQIDDAFLREVEAQVFPADELVIISTSGSTALPKAVVHTHGTAVRLTSVFLDLVDLRPDDRNCIALPLFWVGGLSTNLIISFHVGSALIFPPGPKPLDVAQAIDRERVTRIFTWPLLMRELAEIAAEKGLDVSSVRTGLVAPRDEYGNDIPPHRRSGSDLGMSETFGMHTMEKRNVVLPPSKAGSCGRNVPHVERRIVDPETGLEVAPGKPGELQLRSFSLMRGYYKREREDVFLRDGFFQTGDICSIDEDGYLFFHSRRSEMVKTDGANVSPQEVERVLATAAGVSEALVFGLPHPQKGEAVMAVVVAKDGATVQADALRAHALANLSSYKAPFQTFVMANEDIPRTPSGKPNKPELARMVSAMVDW